MKTLEELRETMLKLDKQMDAVLDKYSELEDEYMEVRKQYFRAKKLEKRAAELNTNSDKWESGALGESEEHAVPRKETSLSSSSEELLLQGMEDAKAGCLTELSDDLLEDENIKEESP